MKTRRALLVIALVWFAIGGVSIYAGAVRTIDNTYRVYVTAPPDVPWTLWLPKPTAAMDIATEGTVVSMTAADTIHGPMHNVTGRGNVTITETLHRTILSLDASRWEGGEIEVSGRANLSGFWIWRDAANPTVDITVLGVNFLRGSQVGGQVQCSSPSFSGHVGTGWNLVAMLFGDCAVVADFLPWPWIFSILFVVPGTILLVLSFLPLRETPKAT